MIEDLVANLIQIKQNFAQNYDGNAHIQEVLPLESTDELPIDSKHLEQLHLFAQKKSNLPKFLRTKYYGIFLYGIRRRYQRILAK